MTSVNFSSVKPSLNFKFSVFLFVSRISAISLNSTNGASGTDLWAALANGQMASYLEATQQVKSILIANISFWVLGVFMIGTAGNLLAGFFKQENGMVKIAQSCYSVAIPLAIVAFICMLSLTMIIAGNGGENSLTLAETIGWIGTRLDDIATALIIGGAPLFLSLAGNKDWMPKWLVYLGYLAGILGVLGLVVLFFPKQYMLGLLILPVGLGWMIATGVVLLRKDYTLADLD